MASGTADLQRDLGGAIMQSIFGALLTAGYAAAFTKLISSSSPNVSSSVQEQLTKSFDGAQAIAKEYPHYSSQITSAAKSSFLQGDQWAYAAGVLAVLLGAIIVFYFFPKHDEEVRLLDAYQADDEGEPAGGPGPPAAESPG